MSILLIVIGLLIFLLVIMDVLVTTLTMRGGGILTSRLSTWLWKCALILHRYRSSNHNFLLVAGWLILVGIPLVWYGLVWTGWTFVFSADEMAVVEATKQTPASLLERIYFVGYTISTLGLGEFVPKGIFWQISTSVASTTGFALVTLSFAYLLPVVSAAARTRSLAVYITTLGGTPDEILQRGWTGKDFGQLDQHLINLTPMILQTAENHLTYPVLHFFHSVERSRSNALSLVALDDALTLLQYGVHPEIRPDPSALESCRRAIAAYLKTLRSAYLEPSDTSPPLPPLENLRQWGIPTLRDRDFYDNIQALEKRRRLLLALLENDGWTWESVASIDTSNRGTSLDDETTTYQAVLR
jgi:hypothetical protein